MRPTTSIFMKLESKGRPQDALTLENVPIREALIQLLKWFGQVQMGHYIKVTVARSAEDLRRYTGVTTASGDIESLVAEFDDLFDWDALEDAEEDAED